MSRLWRQKKEMNLRVRQAGEHWQSFASRSTANRGALKSGDNPQQLLALTTRLDALLRRQDRLQREIERAREPRQENAKPRAAVDAELIEELERHGL